MTIDVTNEYLRREYDNFEKTGALGNLIEELKHSTLIVPMDVNQKGCAMLEINEESFVPLFTDIHEYQKVDFGCDFQPKVFEFNFYIELLKDGLDGFIVNVESEGVPIPRSFLDFLNTNYIFDQDYQWFTKNEIKDIYDSIGNSKLEEFLENDSNMWDFENLIDLLLESDLLTVVVSKDNLEAFQEDGIISLNDVEKPTYFRTRDNYAVLFSSNEKINMELKNYFTYSALVNLPLFIDFVLKSDLAGIKVDENTIISRDFLIKFMKDFDCPSLKRYDDYIFLI